MEETEDKKDGKDGMTEAVDAKSSAGVVQERSSNDIMDRRETGEE